MEFDEKDNPLFVKKLLHWHSKDNNRQMPWKGERDPYKIWLSEIILQQTRVDQGLKYYEKFITIFPTLKDLALAEDDTVFKQWEGLGYYSRCRNLIATARFVYSEKDGKFPDTYDDILQLKGIGTYTASAIASFAFNLPYAVVDGNVYRILSRIFNDHTPIDTTEGKKIFLHLATELLPKSNPAEYNQAIMDFGATVCTPAPKCVKCFFSSHCLAFQADQQNVLPVKLKKNKITERWLNYFLISHNGYSLIRQRTSKDIWQNLYEPLLIETMESSNKDLLAKLLHQQIGIEGINLNLSSKKTQKLSHQLVHFEFFSIEVNQRIAVENYEWVSKTELDKYPFPKTIKEVINGEL